MDGFPYQRTADVVVPKQIAAFPFLLKSIVPKVDVQMFSPLQSLPPVSSPLPPDPIIVSILVLVF